MIRKICEITGTDLDLRHITNHSIRRTTVQHLTQLNVMNEKIMSITGHRSTSGIAAYQTFTKQIMHETINKMIPDKCDDLNSNPGLSKYQRC